MINIYVLNADSKYKHVFYIFITCNIQGKCKS